MTLTLDTLLATLDDLDPALPAIFAGPHGQTQGDWHVTRITHGQLAHVDCDGGRSEDAELVIELLNGPPGAPMDVLRLARILAKGRSAFPGAGAAPLQVLHQSMRHTIDHVSDGHIVLTPVHATCRPADRIGCCA
ncbi:MAG: hypothetical protein AAGE03_03360 [Pseudomonadota bacterium]